MFETTNPNIGEHFLFYCRYLSEQERQKELARLRRELRKAEREEKFGAAAMVLGLAERNAEMEKR